MNRARLGQVKVVCNYGVATTGVDVPNWKCMVCCRPTKSMGLWWQMSGRIQRPFANFRDALILDHSGTSLQFGYPDEDVDWSLQVEGAQARVQDRHKAKKKDKPARRCPKCHAVCRTNQCSCGFEFPPTRHRSTQVTNGELTELARRRRNRTMNRAEKQAYWDKLLHWARHRGYKTAAASCRYREYFGVWPKDLERMPRNHQQSQMPAREFYARYVQSQREAAQYPGSYY
jgi:superfamily II DNA or RNA helicase